MIFAGSLNTGPIWQRMEHVILMAIPFWLPSPNEKAAKYADSRLICVVGAMEWS